MYLTYWRRVIIIEIVLCNFLTMFFITKDDDWVVLLFPSLPQTTPLIMRGDTDTLCLCDIEVNKWSEWVWFIVLFLL